MEIELYFGAGMEQVRKEAQHCMYKYFLMIKTAHS
jgi:hypothetical protein